MKIFVFFMGIVLLCLGFNYLHNDPYNYFFFISGSIMLAVAGLLLYMESRREKNELQLLLLQEAEFENLAFTVNTDLLEIRAYTATYENENFDNSLSHFNDVGVLYALNMFHSKNDVFTKQYDSQPGVLIAYEQEVYGTKIRFREFIPLDEITFKMKVYTSGATLHVQWKSKEEFRFSFQINPN